MEFHDCDDVTLLLDGGSDDAGFVQVIRGKVDDPSPAPDRLMTSDPDQLHRMRPEIIGGTLAIEPDGTFTETIAFTDEASARSGEQLEPPAEIAPTSTTRCRARPSTTCTTPGSAGAEPHPSQVSPVDRDPDRHAGGAACRSGSPADR